MPEGSVRADRLWKRFGADRTVYGVRDHVRHLSQRRRDRDRWRWALRDVSVELEPGESLAVVGANGSGKSTLLKILGGVMYPTAGRLEVGGRVGMLVDVWAGLHHELTGRENLFLAGSLLGLPRSQVASRFDEIVDFAELQDAVDRPTKFYSTGMKMRLGFAVASFLEPDVLLVDEVLAVGDARFQQRCLNRMGKALDDGTTLILVSHDLAAVEATCRRGLWLQDGACAGQGAVGDVLARYRQWVEEAAQAAVAFLPGALRLLKVTVGPGPGEAQVRPGGPLHVSLLVEAEDPASAAICIGVSEGTAAPVFVLRHQARLGAGETEVRCAVGTLPLPRGPFYVWVGAFDGNRDVLPWQPAARFEVVGPGLDAVPAAVVRPAPVYVEASWEVEARR